MSQHRAALIPPVSWVEALDGGTQPSGIPGFVALGAFWQGPLRLTAPIIIIIIIKAQYTQILPDMDFTLI